MGKLIQSQFKSLALTAIVAICCVRQAQAFFLSPDLPCEFLESINITAGVRHTNKSIVYQGVEYPKNQYAEVNYILENGSEKIPTKPYFRGCLCNIKKCIRLCCPYGQIVDITIKVGKKCRVHESAKNFETEIQHENNQVSTVALDDHFSYVDDRPCKSFYEAEEYRILHTGQIYHSNASHGHKSYCLKASYNEKANESDLKLLMCVTEEVETRFYILSKGMLLSVPFIIATILVYLCIPELRNIHGKCLLCYLLGLVLGYSSLGMVQLNGSRYVEPLLCRSVGYLIYFSFLSAFLWLSVISFDLWWNFRTMHHYKVFSERKRFFLYVIYAWGLSLCLTLMAYVLDSTESLPESLQPGVGVGTCFLKKERLTEFLFFYLPMFIIISVNIIFFILTAIKIRQTQHELSKITSKEESTRHRKNLNSDRDNFVLFLRLFIVMGVTWSMEVISWAIGPESNFFYLTDICNTVQGVIIFVLFVLKRHVFRLIKKRWQIIFGKSITNGSVGTNSTSATQTRASNLRLNQITTTTDKKDATD